MATIIDTLADFTTQVRFDQLPPHVIDESKRVLLDSIGCGLGGLSHSKGTIGVEYARMLGNAVPGARASILGTGDRVSTVATAFANGELINVLDYDAILPPGHASPYVLPGAMAVGEAGKVSGQEILCATAIAAIGRLKGHTSDQVEHGMGIAARISPVNSHWVWSQHAPSTTIKYTPAGPVVQAAMTAAHMAELGHRGDRMMLHDGEFGYRRIIGSTRWAPENILPGLGSEWFFPAEQSYKPYPHCRILHALLDCLIDIVETHDIRVDEIEGINARVEAFVMQPIWLLRKIKHVTDAQFSVAHGLSVGAHRIPPGKAWQSPEVVFKPSVLALMERVTFEVHPDYEKLVSANAASRPARLEVRARGKSFTGEKRFPRGSPSPEPETTMTTDELLAKFVGNAQGVLSPSRTDEVIGKLLALAQVDDFSSVMALLSK